MQTKETIDRKIKIDIAGFQKVAEDKYVYTKTNFWGFKDVSKRYVLNKEQRDKIWRSYRLFWIIVGTYLFLSIFGFRDMQNGALGCWLHVGKIFCTKTCIPSLSIPISFLLYKAFLMYNQKCLIKFPGYHSEQNNFNTVTSNELKTDNKPNGFHVWFLIFAFIFPFLFIFCKLQIKSLLFN